jgi:hypothetical protein
MELAPFYYAFSIRTPRLLAQYYTAIYSAHLFYQKCKKYFTSVRSKCGHQHRPYLN